MALTTIQIISVVLWVLLVLVIFKVLWNFKLRIIFYGIVAKKRIQELADAIETYKVLEMDIYGRSEFYLNNPLLKGTHKDLIKLAESRIIKKQKGEIKNEISRIQTKKPDSRKDSTISTTTSSSTTTNRTTDTRSEGTESNLSKTSGTLQTSKTRIFGRDGIRNENPEPDVEQDSDSVRRGDNLFKRKRY